MKLSEILSKDVNVDFEFIDLIKEEAQRDGSTLVRFVLKEPMDQVMGRRVNNPQSGDTVNLAAFDVQMISIGAEALSEIDKLEDAGEPVIEWSEVGKSGHFRTNKLRLDVSRNQEVWVVKTSLAAWSRQQQSERRAKQDTDLANRIRERLTKKEFNNGNDGTGTGNGTDPSKPVVVAKANQD